MAVADLCVYGAQRCEDMKLCSLSPWVLSKTQASSEQEWYVLRETQDLSQKEENG